MSINLVKGQNIDLTKGSPIKKFAIACGWDVNENKSFFSKAFDLDVAVFILNENEKYLSKNHFVYFGNLKTPNKSVVHSGDNLTGAGDGDDEVIMVDISKLEPEATEIPIIVAIYKASSRNQSFGQVRNAFVRIFNPDTKVEIARYNLTDEFSKETAVEFGRLYKRNGEWKFRAIGTGEQAGLNVYRDRFK